MRAFLITLSLIGFYSSSISQTPQLIFQSGYEGTSEVIQYMHSGTPDTNHADIIGVDMGLDWEDSINVNPYVGFFVIRYEDGDTSVSKADIVSDPVDPLNNVLEFQISEAHILYNDSLEKGRIQAAFTPNTDLTDFHFSQRFFVHPDLEDLTTYPGEINWLTIQEFWNNGTSKPFTFRVTLNIRKIAGVDSLYFGAHGQTKDTITDTWEDEWDTIATSFPIPFGSWMDIETKFVEGDEFNGKFQFNVTDSSGNTYNVIDITGFTHHPADPSPDGVTSFNPMKLYTSKTLIDSMATKCLCLYWDDFELWKDFAASSSIQEHPNSQEIAAFPNPSNDQVTIQTSYKKGTRVEIYDLMGKKMSEFKLINSSSFVLSKSQFGKGMFIIRFFNESQEPRTIKIIFD
jgi:hypothetical protein